MPRVYLVAVFLLGLTISPAGSQVKRISPDSPPAPQPGRVAKLILKPAGSPSPTLKYHLLPEIRDQRPGNAALFYQRAHSPEAFNPVRRQPDYEKRSDWAEMPLDKMPLERARNILPYQALKELDYAARRDLCDWQMVERVRKEGIAMLLPDLQSFRELAGLLALRARVEMREGRPDKAVYSLQTGLTLGRHVAEAPTLINGLVGLAIAQIMCQQIEQLIQLPEAPNLYWALTDLPRPFIDLRKPMQAEKIMVDWLVPDLREALTDLHARPLSPQEIQKKLDMIRGLLGIIQARPWDRFAAAIAAAKVYPQARKFLLDQGRTPADVDALPVVQVTMMYSLAQYDRHFDELYKWQNLPYWEARAGLLQAEQKLKKRKNWGEGILWAKLLEPGWGEGIPLAELLIPAVKAVMLARARLDRRLAALRSIEALRLYAAGHDGKLPASLADIKEVPLPIDPVTGKSFEYRLLQENHAILYGSPPPGEGPAESFRYELTLRK